MKGAIFNFAKRVFSNALEGVKIKLSGGKPPDPQFPFNVLSFHCQNLPKVVSSCDFLMTLA